MTSDPKQLRDRRDAVKRDIEELAIQVEVGEVAPETAERLRASYQQELDTLDAALGGGVGNQPATAPPPAEPEPSAAVSQEEPSRSPRRTVGAVLIVGALVAAVFFAVQTAEPDAQGPGGLTVDPASVANEELEAIVAANPEVTAMRMALADRYFEAEEYGASLDHYLFLAENSPDARERSKALARVGWMAYITDQPQAADEYMVRSLEADPTNSEAILYRGFVTLYGLGDAEAAIPQLEAALELTNLSDRVVEQVDEALADARGGGQ